MFLCLCGLSVMERYDITLYTQEDAKGLVHCGGGGGGGEGGQVTSTVPH